jgi:hypothetical protein
MLIATQQDKSTISEDTAVVERQFREYALGLCREGDAAVARQPEPSSRRAC